MESYTRDDALKLLQDKQKELAEGGENRYPRRSDFTEAEVVAIKAHLGPFPRALEAAGIKPPRPDDRIQKTREKRIRIKRARNAARREGRVPADSNAPEEEKTE